MEEGKGGLKKEKEKKRGQETSRDDKQEKRHRNE
jgi:hypothetical protein